ncbi:MAG: dephospho-CoA kinase [Bdellovibrionales bacterium]|nr:dephospho-CoA kinase [Bdellovibrionales bacterium]
MKPKWCKNAIALTGSLGSGKSTVLKQLEQLGAYVLSADDLAREVTLPGQVTLRKIVERFGEQLLDPSGKLKRDALAELVFADKTARQELEAITHPAIRELAQAKFEAAMRQGYPLYVYEVPLLFETQMEGNGFLAIVVVTCPEDQALQRVSQLRGISLQNAKARLAAQLPAQLKASKADYIIENSGSLEDLQEKVGQLYFELCALTN